MKRLISIADLIKDEVVGLMDEADRFKEVICGRRIKKLPTLRGRTVYNLLYENSIRTRSSSEIAGKWVSADVISISASSSPVKKGESLRDIALILDAIDGDAIVVRYLSSGTVQLIAKWTEEFGNSPSIINAGDGKHQHPTRALLDAVTLRQCLGGIEGRKVVIIGDILYPRIARSNVDLLSKLGAEVVFAAPLMLLPFGIETWPVRVVYRMEDEIRDANTVVMLRVQQERMYGSFFPSYREYTARCGLSKAREKMLRDDYTVMHPGLMFRGMETNDAAADLPRTAVLQRVVNGVHVHMAVLFTLLTSGVSANLEGQT